jgi:hypothetical protein
VGPQSGPICKKLSSRLARGDAVVENDTEPKSDIEVIAALEVRNGIRKQSGLPEVEEQYELNRISKLREQYSFERWMESPLRYRVEHNLLMRVRRRANNPDWEPTGMLSGGGWAFHVALVKQMRKLKERSLRRT